MKLNIYLSGFIAVLTVSGTSFAQGFEEDKPWINCQNIECEPYITADGINNYEFRKYPGSQNVYTFDVIEDMKFDRLQTHEDLIIPSTIHANGKTFNVTGIFTNSFGAVSGLTIPSSIRTIHQHGVFSSNITRLEFEEGLVNIMDGNFKYLQKLNALRLPSSLLHIGNDCFNKGEFNTLDLGNGVMHIGNECFNDNSSIEAVDLPASLHSLGRGCFNNLPALKHIIIPKWLKKMDNCFNECPAIEIIEFKSITGPLEFNECFNDIDKDKCLLVVPDDAQQNFINMLKTISKNVVTENEWRKSHSIVSEFEFTDENTCRYYTLDGVSINSFNTDKNQRIIISTDGKSSMKILK